MSTKRKNIILTYVMVFFLFGLSAFCWLKPTDAFSNSERRELAQFPSLSIESIFNQNSDKTFTTLFESYTLDQFPLRDTFRTLKSYVSFYVFQQLDNNNIYVENGYAAQMEYTMNESSLDYAANKFQNIYDKFITDTNAEVYFSIVPDKGYFLSKQTGHLSMDYDKFLSLMQTKVNFATFIDITDVLELEDYYKTDTHWRQERIIDVAEKLASSMGTTLSAQYNEITLDNPFYGVYYGQSALPLPAEEIKYLTNEILENCIVYDHANQKEISFYDMERAYQKDPYEMFLSGNLSVITIENPNATTNKELIIFRDSFGSSLTPLLVCGYSKITVIDIRQIQSVMLGTLKDTRTGNVLIDFENADDVLFLYSTLVLNNSSTLK